MTALPRGQAFTRADISARWWRSWWPWSAPVRTIWRFSSRLSTDEPSITAWELHDGTYVETAHAVGNQRFHTTRPYDVILTVGR